MYLSISPKAHFLDLEILPEIFKTH